MFLDNMVHSSENREQVKEVEVHWTENVELFKPTIYYM